MFGQIKKWHYQPTLLDNALRVDDSIFSFINNKKILHDFIGVHEDEHLKIAIGKSITIEYKNNVYIVADVKKANFKKIFDKCYLYEEDRQRKPISCLLIRKYKKKYILHLFNYDKTADVLRYAKSKIYDLGN